MSENENFDESIRNALEGHEFPFDENNWEKARLLIDEDRKQKKRRMIFLFFFFPGILLVGITVWYIVNESIARHLVAEKQNTTAVAKKSIAANKSTDNQTKKSSAASAVPGPDPVSKAAPENLSEKSVSPPQQTNLPDPTEKKKGIMQGTKENQQPKPTKEKPLQNQQPGSDPPKESPLAIITGNNPDDQQPKPTAVSTPDEKKDKKEPAVTAITGSNPTDQKPLTAEPNIVAMTDEKKNEPVQTTPTQSVTTTDNTAALKTDSLQPVAAVKDTTPAVNNPPKDSVPPEAVAKSRFTVLAGAAYLFAWNRTNNDPGNGFNPVGGIAYSHALSRQFSVSAGLQYLSVYNSSSDPMTIINKQYDFGETREVTTIHTKKLHYITMPLRISYPAHSKNAFSAGCNVGYLFYSTVETQRYIETDFMRSDINVTRSKGVFNGFNSLDIQAAISYRRRIWKNLSLEAEVFSGLSDVINNNQFDAGSPQKNKGIKLTFQYDLQKF